VTDALWFQFLRGTTALDEVNFWSPSGRLVRADRGVPFLFKLKSPRNVLVGGGFLSFAQRMPIRDAWEFFGRENGAASLEDLKVRIRANRWGDAKDSDVIGCMILSQPFFFQSPIAPPEDWPPNTQSGKYYLTRDKIAQRVWHDVTVALAETSSGVAPIAASPFGGYALSAPQPRRLGQGAFRKLVLDAYGRRCAVSGEHAVPVLQASHIKPFADVEHHEVTNGLALRSDIHILFDQGYVTVTPDYRFLVSERLREDFDNGQVYYEYARRSQTILLPSESDKIPDREGLEWHMTTKFKG